MSDFIDKLQEALLISYIGDVGCKLSNADCNELSKFLQSVKSKDQEIDRLNALLVDYQEHTKKMAGVMVDRDEHPERPTYDDLRAEALTWRATAEHYRDAQQRVAVATQKRGYREGWTDEQFLARQVVKLQEELGELGYYIYGAPNKFFRKIENLRMSAKETFDNLDAGAWKSGLVDIRPGNINDEVSDCMVVLFNIAAVLEQITGEKFDLVQEAVKKAEADIDRGVRK